MKRKDLQRALDAGGTVVIEGVVRVDRPLLVTKESRIEGGVLIGDADVVLLDVQAPTTIVGTEVARTGGFGHGIRTTSELVLDKVRVSGGRNWAWEKQRRPPLPTEGFGAGVFVASSGSLKAKGLVVSGCTGAGLTAEGPVRWTRGSARSCRWGLLCTSGATKVSRVSFRECSEGVFHDGRGDLSLKSCRIEENTVGLVAYGPGPTTVSGGSVKGNRASGVFAHLLGDLRLEGGAFEGNRSADIAACGWSDVKQTDCSLGEAGVAIEDLARVDGERGPAGDHDRM